MTFSGFPLIKVFLFITFVASVVVTDRFLRAYAIAPAVDITCPSPAVMIPGQTKGGFTVIGGVPGTSYVYEVSPASSGTFNPAARTLTVGAGVAVGSTVQVIAKDAANTANQDSCSIQIVERLNVPNCPSGRNGLGYTPEQGGAQSYQFQKTGDCGAAGCVWDLEEGRWNGSKTETVDNGSTISSTGLFIKGPGVVPNTDSFLVSLLRSDGATTGVNCGYSYYRERLIELRAEDQPPILIGEEPVELQYRGGPGNRSFVRWQLLESPGSLNPDTGVYTPSEDYDDLETPISVKVIDEVFPSVNYATATFTPTRPACPANFGLYDLYDRPLALAGQTLTKGIYPGVTYRFFVKNAIVPGAFNTNDFERFARDNDVPMTFARGVSEEGVSYFDFQFNEGADYEGNSFPFFFWDFTVTEGEGEEGACRVDLQLEHRGLRLHAKNSKRVRMNIH